MSPSGPDESRSDAFRGTPKIDEADAAASSPDRHQIQAVIGYFITASGPRLRSVVFIYQPQIEISPATVTIPSREGRARHHTVGIKQTECGHRRRPHAHCRLGMMFMLFMQPTARVVRVSPSRSVELCVYAYCSTKPRREYDDAHR